MPTFLANRQPPGAPKMRVHGIAWPVLHALHVLHVLHALSIWLLALAPSLLPAGVAAAANAPLPAASAATGFDIAITVDDLPAHGPLPRGMTRVSIAEDHLRAFAAHGVPQAFGFVNAIKLTTEPGSEAALDAWRKAGQPLGNHTFTHLNLDRAPSIAAWQDDVVAGEAAVASRMEGANWRYLRFANLGAGDERRAPALAFLRGRGYRVADVSVAFGDWEYTDAYARCVATGDAPAIAAMKHQYLDNVEHAIARMQSDSTLVYGRVIAQVLLTHIGGWSAVTLPDVLARLDAAGARYVSLEQAQADPAYAEAGGGSIIHRTARQRGIVLAPLARSAPALDLKALCRPD